MPEPMKLLLRDSFARVMRVNMTGDHYNLLPSQAAKIVGDRYGLDAAQVLLAFAKN